MSKDCLRKYLAHNKTVKISIIDMTNSVQELRELHNVSNVCTAALGRTLMASEIIASRLKEKNAFVTVHIKGDGPMGTITCITKENLEAKIVAKNMKVELPLKLSGKLDVSSAIGKGTLNVIKDLGLKEPYIGISNLISSEIAEDFTYYFASSEQTPCAIALGVLIGKDNKVSKACGYIIEPLPDCDEKVITLLENINSNIKSVTYLCLDLGNLDEVVKSISGDNNIEYLEELYPTLSCDCNREKIEKLVIALGKEEITKILKENNRTFEVSCQFCNKSYSFTGQDIQKLFN